MLSLRIYRLPLLRGRMRRRRQLMQLEEQQAGRAAQQRSW
jgi:hypothetical protein